MIRYTVFLLYFCFWIGKTFSTPNCNGGDKVNHFDWPCNCTGLSNMGRKCDDVLRPGLILQPLWVNEPRSLEITERYAAVVKPTKEGWVLQNTTTNTVIVIRKDLKYTVYFDERTVDRICKLRSEDELSKVPDEIVCRLHNKHHTRYHACSFPSDASSDEDVIRVLERNETTVLFRVQDWVFPCPDRATVTATPLTTRETGPASKDSCHTIAHVIGAAVAAAVIALGIGFAAGRASKGCSKRLLGNADRRRNTVAFGESGRDQPTWDGKNVPMDEDVGEDRDEEQRKLMEGNKETHDETQEEIHL